MSFDKRTGSLEYLTQWCTKTDRIISDKKQTVVPILYYSVKEKDFSFFYDLVGEVVSVLYFGTSQPRLSKSHHRKGTG
jgi:hypothetical protein